MSIVLFGIALAWLVYALTRRPRSRPIEYRASKEALQTCARVARLALYPNDR